MDWTAISSRLQYVSKAGAWPSNGGLAAYCMQRIQCRRLEDSPLNPDQVANLLRRAIREGVRRPGDELIQDELARRLGVSRIPLREAFRTLAAEGLITIRPGRGATVTKLDLAEVTELYNLRLVLEPPLAEPVMANHTNADIDRLTAMVAQMEEDTGEDPEAWSNFNYEFHRSTYELANRPHTLRLVTQILNLVEPYSRIYVHYLDHLDRVHAEHRMMIEALRSGDSNLLASAIADHLEGARDGLAKAMESALEPNDPLSLLQGPDPRIGTGTG